MKANPRKLEIHPVAAIFPLMEGKPFEDLVADIREHGQREPVYLLNGKVIDGRNRVNACKRCGIDVSTVKTDWDGDPVVLVMSLNIHRRHLTDSQRAIIAAP